MTSSSLEVKVFSTYRLEMAYEDLSIGELAERAGVATSALRFYEAEGLIHARRTASGHRRFARDTLRRVAFVRVAQRVGLSLQEIREALATLPDHRTPTERDWQRLATSWTPRLEEQIRVLERLRDRLVGCIGCGCLSMKACALVNPGDEAAAQGTGPRYVLGERP